MAKERFTWLIKPKSFVQLIGAEYHLLKKSGSGWECKVNCVKVLVSLSLLRPRPQEREGIFL